MKRKFNNTPNACLHTGSKIKQEYFVSRSVAVVGVVFAYTPIGLHVLLTKRSDTMEEEPGKFCLPSGYLDWNETCYEAMVREVYEETSLYIPEFEDNIVSICDKKPFLIRDDPNANTRQNITFLYLTVFNFKKMEDFPIEVQNFTSKETSKVEWVYINEIEKYCSPESWAFKHNNTIKLAFEEHERRIIDLLLNETKTSA